MIVSVSAPAFADGETTEKGYTVYTEEEYKALNLETKLVNYWKPGVLDEQVAVADRLDTTPAKYLFKTNDTADSKEYIILKNVNAGANDGYFVMVNNYVDSCKQTQYNSGYNANCTEISRYFDIKDPNCAAYKMNLDTYISANFPLMKDYINTHRWYTEDTSYSSKYSTDAKISLLSLTEYVVNADRIGMQNGLQQWLTRTPNGSKLLWQFIVSTKGADGSATV